MSTITIRLKQVGEATVVRVLVTHPMETGRRKDPKSDRLIPARFIQKMLVRHEATVVASCELGPGISADPYFSFRFRNGKPGDLVTVFWQDNLGYSDTSSARIR
ncbi:MAG: thiosulfate oxidation carrier complex protein SoxZ [Gammaproteobacteria bacterium]